MNAKQTSLALVAVVALLAGCSKNPFETPSTSNGLSDLEIASVNSVQTRAVIDGTDFPVTGEIGLFLFKDEQAETPYGESGYTNVKYSYNSDKERWTASPSIKVGSTSGYLYGYYPYNSESTDVKEIPVASSLNGDDVMYASKQVEPITDKTASSTSIVMNHALARVSITIKNNGYTGAAKFSKIKFGGAKTAENGSLNALDGKITATNSDVTLDVPTANQTITATGSTYECLLVPSGKDESKQAVDLTLTIDDKDMTATLSGDNGVIIAQNTKSNITITLSNKGISVQTVSVENWNVIEVGGHKVTVKFSDDVIPHDILTEAYVDGNNVIIRASSFQGRSLACNVGDNAKCERSFTNDKFTFIISEICSNIEAVLGYSIVSISVKSDDSNGKVWIGDDESKTSGQFYSGQQVVIHAAPKDKFRFFRWNDNNNETSRTVTVGGEDITYSASFISSDLIPGLFTVNSSGKQVFFSKGNLWYGMVGSATTASFNFEANQYTVYTKSGDETENHVALFYWSKSVDVARTLLNYSDTDTSSDDVFFANNPGSFEAGGHNGWSVLTGGTKGEWKYLIDRNGGTLYKVGVTVCDSENCLILLPDDWKWGENGVGTDWLSEYSESTTVKWSTMENAGAVCLPAAGYRNGRPGRPDPANVSEVGNRGHYWSASPEIDLYAYYLAFYNGNVNPSISDYRHLAYSVRLVTESK